MPQTFTLEEAMVAPESKSNVFTLEEAMINPTVEVSEKRGFGDKVKYFLGQTAKAVTTGVELLPAGFESVVQASETAIREIAKKHLEEDGAVFGISQEDFLNRDKETKDRIALNSMIIEKMDSALETSKRLQRNWIEATQTGIEAIDPELMRGTFMENPSFTRAWVMGLQSFPMLGLAAAISYVTKSPTIGAAVLSSIEASEEFVKGVESGQKPEEAGLGFTANLVMLSALETIPLTGFMKGGTLPIRMFRGAIQEGGEEVLQALWKNSVAQIGYDDTRKLTEGMVEGFIAGSLSGGLVGSFSPRNNVFETISQAKLKGVDTEKMMEAVGKQVINNADKITENILSKETPEAIKNSYKNVVSQQKTIEEEPSVLNKNIIAEGQNITNESKQQEYQKNINLKSKITPISKAGNSIKNIFDDSLKGADSIVGVLSTRAQNVSPEFRDKLIKFEYESAMKLKQYEEKSIGFHSKFNLKNMGDDFYTLDLALKNGDVEVSDSIIKKYNLEKEYNDVKDVLNQIREEAINVGIDVGFVENYFPRVVDDVEGFMKKIRQDENWNTIEKAIYDEEKRIGYPLTDDDKARLITNMIAGFGKSQIRIGGTKFSKQRTIKNITAEYNEFYKEGNEALSLYLRSMNAMIQGRKLLGRESKSLVNIRRKLKLAKNRLNEINEKDSKDIKSKKLGQLYAILDNIKRQIKTTEDIEKTDDLNNKIGDIEDYIDFIKKIKPSSVKSIVIKNLDGRIQSLEDEINLSSTNLDKGIGAFVNSMLDKKIISQDKVKEVQSILKARLNPKQMTNESVIFLRDVAYFSTLNDITNGITQLGDLWLSVYKNGFGNSLVGLSNVISGKNVITRNDIGIGDTVSAEFLELKNRDKARRFIFKYSAIQPIDALGKSTFITSAWNKMKIQANANNEYFKNEVQRVFEDNWEVVWNDIKKGNLTYDAKYLLFSALSKVQPISLSEVPEAYLVGGDWKIVYALKTFALKAMDIARNDVYNQIRQGNIKEGAKNLFRLTVVFALMGASTDALKKFIMGRAFDLQESAIDGILQLIMFNRYMGVIGQREGYMKAFLQSQIPPFYKIGDDLIKDVQGKKEIQDWKSWRNIPLIGEPFYWWVGGGKEYKRKEKIRIRKEQARRKR